MYPIEGGKGILKHKVFNSGEHLTVYRPLRKNHAQNVCCQNISIVCYFAPTVMIIGM